MTSPVFVNSAIVRVPERLVLRGGRWAFVDLKVRYGVWRHPRLGPVLIDTGYGGRVTDGAGRSRMLKLYGAALRPRLVDGGQPRRWLAAQGIDPGTVGHIIVTHFHPDHIAALRDFPAAQFLASGPAYARLTAMRTLQKLHNGFFAELLPADFGRRLLPVEARPQVLLPHGLGAGFDLFGDGTCLCVPLPGHALGHFGLLWPQASPPLLYATDVQWLLRAIIEDRPPAGPARLIGGEARAAALSAEKVRRFAAAGGSVVLCHEPADDLASGEPPA